MLFFKAFKVNFLATLFATIISPTACYAQDTIPVEGGSPLTPFDKYSNSNWTVSYSYEKVLIETGWNVINGIDTIVHGGYTSKCPEPPVPVLSEMLGRPLNSTPRSHIVASSFSGKYKATLTWQYPNEEKPDYIYVKEHATASYQYSPSGNATASNGLGSPTLTEGPLNGNIYIGSSSGFRYKRVAVPASGIIVLDEVTVTADATSIGAYSDAHTTGDYYVEVVPIFAEIASSLGITYFMDSRPASFGAKLENIRQDSGRIAIDLGAIVYSHFGGSHTVEVESDLLGIKKGVWTDPYHEWLAWGVDYYDTWLSERTQIPAHEANVWSGSTSDYVTWAANAIKGGALKNGIVTFKVSQLGGSGPSFSNDADVTIHFPQEHTEITPRQKAYGNWQLVSSELQNTDQSPSKTREFEYTLTAGIEAGISAECKVPIEVIELAFGLSLSASMGLEIKEKDNVIIPYTWYGCMIARKQWWQSQMTYHSYNANGFEGIETRTIKEGTGASGLPGPWDFQKQPYVYPSWFSPNGNYDPSDDPPFNNPLLP